MNLALKKQYFIIKSHTMKKIYLISNDKIWFSDKRYTSNNDLNNIITCLNKNYDLNLLCKKVQQN